MSVSCNLYRLDKKNNSTARPTNQTPVIGNLTGLFNVDTSVLAPVVDFNFSAPENLPSYNYMEIPEFHRYYYIKEWEWVSGFWRAHTTIDALATYKNDIGAASMYVLRSAAEFNGNYTDNKYPSQNARSNVCTTKSSPFYSSFNNGFYIVGIVNNDDSSIGATAYYLMRPAEFKSLRYALFNSIDYMAIQSTELSQDLQKALVNPFQYVVSAMWFPFDTTFDLSAKTTPLQVGWWPLSGTQGFTVPNPPYYHWNGTITVPKHPQAAARGSYLNNSPYSTYSLEFWPWGQLALDSSKLVNVSSLKLSIVVDFITGVGVLRVTGDDDTGAITVATAQVGVPIQLAQTTLDFSQLSTTAGLITQGTGIGAGYLSNKLTDWFGDTRITQKISAIASDISDGANAVMTDVNVNGSNGGTAVFSLSVRVNAHFVSVAADDNANNGRPLCAMRTLSTLPGFQLLKTGALPLTGATRTERELVEQYLTSGYYYE